MRTAEGKRAVEARKCLRRDERRAWREYLETVKGRPSNNGYEEVESWAWARLQAELERIAARKEALGV